MQIGGKRNTIHIERLTSSDPTISGASEVWALFCGGLKASIWPLKGDEAVIGMQTLGSVTHRIRCRYRAGVLSDMRIRSGNKIYTISAPPINLENRGEEMELLCSEVVRG